MSDESGLLSTVGAVSLFVDDPARSKEFYERVFDRAAVYEDEASVVVRFGELMVNLLARSAAPELIAPAPVAASGGPAALQFTIWVADVDAAAGVVKGRGVVLLNGPIDRPWGQRTICFADPDGYVWEIAQALGA